MTPLRWANRQGTLGASWGNAARAHPWGDFAADAILKRKQLAQGLVGGAAANRKSQLAWRDGYGV